jgi:two-component system sensor histidine kinase ChvG
LFSETGELLGDSAMLSETGRIHIVPPAAARAAGGAAAAAAWATGSATGSARQLSRSDRFPAYVERAQPTLRDFPEAASALRGFNASAVRIMGDDRLLLSAAVPEQRYKQVLGALILSRDNPRDRRLACARCATTC